MSKTIKTLALSALAVGVMASGTALAGVTGNVSATSNYLWRGISQNGDDAAVQGGIDYAHESGFYVGTWASSLGDATVGTPFEGYELDLYGGYKFDAGGITLDVGAIGYLYPLETSPTADVPDPDYDDSYYEVYLGVGIDAFSAKISHSPDVDLSDADNAATYLEAAYALGPVSFHVGDYLFEEDINADGDDSYFDYSVAIAKDEFTFGVSNTNLEGYDDPRVFVTYKKGFEL